MGMPDVNDRVTITCGADRARISARLNSHVPCGAQDMRTPPCLDRLLRLAEAIKRPSEIDQCLQVAGPAGDGAAIADNSIGRPVELHQHVALLEVCLCIVRAHASSFGTMRRRLLQQGARKIQEPSDP